MQGSGKTLAFGLPILQLLLVEREQRLSVQGAAKDNAAGDSGAAATAEADMQEGAAEGGGKRNCKGGDRGPLRALVLAPTRELAMQVRCIASLHSPYPKPLTQKLCWK